MFTAKNNLVLARAAQRKYDLPVIEMTQTERAELLYTLALAAIKQGDVSVGKGLLQQAVDTHPQHFEAAARSLAALDANVTQLITCRPPLMRWFLPFVAAHRASGWHGPT